VIKSRKADDAPAAARVPRHIAIVMDGNGRWAKQRRRPRSFGHRAGQKTVRSSIEFCLKNGIEALTLFAFSSENWQRPPAEVSALMELFLKALDREVAELHGNGVRIRFIGELNAFAKPLRERMLAAMQKTAANDKLALNVAVNYGGRWDIANAAREAARAVAAARSTRRPSTRKRWRPTSRFPICRRWICSSAPAASSASAISFCGSWPTRNCISAIRFGPISTQRACN
jgi:undecaprenyl diphosphate synthase